MNLEIQGYRNLAKNLSIKGAIFRSFILKYSYKYTYIYIYIYACVCMITCLLLSLSLSRTSQETHYVSVTESSQLMLCKI
jgi:hypothetical protein